MKCPKCGWEKWVTTRKVWQGTYIEIQGHCGYCYHVWTIEKGEKNV